MKIDISNDEVILLIDAITTSNLPTKRGLYSLLKTLKQLQNEKF